MRAYWRLALQAVEPIGKAGTPVKPLATVTPGRALGGQDSNLRPWDCEWAGQDSNLRPWD
jgi:hypothetical protein